MFFKHWFSNKIGLIAIQKESEDEDNDNDSSRNLFPSVKINPL